VIVVHTLSAFYRPVPFPRKIPHSQKVTATRAILLVPEYLNVLLALRIIKDCVEEEKSQGVTVGRDQDMDHEGIGERNELCGSGVLRPPGARDAAKAPAKDSPRTSEMNGSRTLDAIIAAAGANSGPVKLGGARTKPQQQLSPKPTRKGRQPFAWRPRINASSMTAMTTTIAAYSKKAVRIK
jgi:hypothetical protein